MKMRESAEFIHDLTTQLYDDSQLVLKALNLDSQLEKKL